MALIILPILFAIWAFFFLPYAEKIPIWLKWKNPKRARWILIILFSILPFGDEIVGKLRFAYECRLKTELFISSEINSYSSLKMTDQSLVLSNIPIKIYINETRYNDIHSGKNAIKDVWLSTRGGWIRRELNIFKPNICQAKYSENIPTRLGFKYEKNAIFLKK